MILDLTIASQVVMASKASRLLKSVRLMLAREKSYDVSQAEEGKRGRKAGRTAYHHRFDTDYLTQVCTNTSTVY